MGFALLYFSNYSKAESCHYIVADKSLVFFGLARQVVGERVIAEAVASAVEGQSHRASFTSQSGADSNIRIRNC